MGLWGLVGDISGLKCVVINDIVSTVNMHL